MNSPYKVEYRAASRSEKCVWCAKAATQEAVQRQGNMTSITRCCDDPKCIVPISGDVRAHIGSRMRSYALHLLARALYHNYGWHFLSESAPSAQRSSS